MNPQDKIKLFYDEIWNRYDKSKIPELLHEEVTFRGSLGETRQGHSGFAQYVDRVHTALGDYRCEIEEIIVQGEKAFARMKFSGIHRAELMGCAATNKRVEWAGAAVFTFKAGKLVDLWVLGDLHSLLQQLRGSAGAPNDHMSQASG